MKKVILGMSGGIDSSTSAYILKQEGYEVIGVTFKLYSDGSSKCCEDYDITNAKILANKLGIEHHVLNFENEFKKYVIKYFSDTYLNGKTPNPCVICNEFIKIPFLFAQLSVFNADYVATGHYCNITKDGNKYFFSQAKDLKKTQEYFLSRVDKKYLKKIIFPLANYTKKEILTKSVQISKELNYKYKKSESQELCFIKSDQKYSDFIKIENPYLDFSGKIINKKGIILKEIDNIFKYTIGQRKGLGVSDATPYYVIKIDLKNRVVVVGKKEDIFSLSFNIENIMEYKKLSSNIEYNIKVRYKSPSVPGKINLKENSVALNKPVNAITPGQLVVFYENDIVVGSAWIK